MPRTSSITHKMNYRFEFHRAIRGHHIYKDVWVPCIGQKLKCKTNILEEAMEYDKNSIGVFKSEDPAMLVGHLPIDFSYLLKYFLKTSGNKLIVMVI